VEEGGIRDACQGAVGLLCVVWLSRFSLSVCVEEASRRYSESGSTSTSTLHPAFEDGTDRGFRNVGKPQSDAGEIHKRIHTIFKTRRKFVRLISSSRIV
jgi:hypothetical protein